MTEDEGFLVFLGVFSAMVIFLTYPNVSSDIEQYEDANSVLP